MANLIAIDPIAHKNLTIDPSKAELHGAELNLIPAVVAEFNHLAVQYPIVITKNEETGAFVFAAMLGFEVNENLFWQQGKWSGVYIPLQLQRQPFFVGNLEENSVNNNSDYPVCIDMESPAVIPSNSASTASNENQLLFNEVGQDSEYFQQIKQCLAQLLQGEVENDNLITVLKNFDLIQPLSLEITFENGKNTRLNGLYTIDQKKLAQLTAEQIVTLHQQHLLQPIYAIITSLGQIYPMIELKNKQTLFS